ncbi:MAG: HAMP domain-containing protein [Rhodocyclaceae bacterium]|nr:HAMP domain-containing protein [Rhodocyclaceae bacterium]MBX3669865.1 HAMP domain-containing protein [Rhodocyclaceae bacterium]
MATKQANFLGRVPALSRLGIRAKLILLFVLIKVVPLVLLAIVAWEGIGELGRSLSSRANEMASESRDTLNSLGTVVIKESERALDLKARESIERLTTDTARAVASFLYERDADIRFAAALQPGESTYRALLASRTRRLIEPGTNWDLAADGKKWLPQATAEGGEEGVEPANPENRQDFNYRAPDASLRGTDAPLYHEITFIGLDGQEKLKVEATNLLAPELRDVTRRENTYARAESYWPEVKKLKPGEIYVSDVIGPYVGSHVIGTFTPDKAKKAGVAFEPKSEAYAGVENPLGRKFRGIVRWAAPVVQGGRTVGYVTLALDHSHIMSFTDHIMPTAARYTAVPDATSGNYAFMWDYRDRNIAHPRHYSIVGFDPATGRPATPWLDQTLYDKWQASGEPLERFLAGVPDFDGQTREKKPAGPVTKAGLLGLDCRYLNFAPQCQGWNNLTNKGGSGSFVILWSGIWKLTTAATIPYFTGPYGNTPRGFGYVTIGANVDEFHKAATETRQNLDARIASFSQHLDQAQDEMSALIVGAMSSTASKLTVSTVVMVAVVVAIAIWLASLLSGRITAISAGLRRIREGELSHRFERTSDDELGQLSDSLNRMTQSVEESFQRLEDARVNAEQANRMKSEFLAAMSHELRTPLNGILGFAELLSLEAANDDQREWADTIRSSGAHLLDLLNSILDLAKIEAHHMQIRILPEDPRKLMNDLAAVHRGQAQAKGLELTASCADDVPERFHTDAMRLRQILNNLLNNAVKFTDAGGISLRLQSCARGLRFEVEDSGCGIAAEDQSLIFERFQQGEKSFVTRKHGGTGLGLALVRELTNLMGGEVGLKSAPGAGATFWVELPNVPAAPPAAQENAANDKKMLAAA